jgi:hypothetical protein
MNRYSRARAIRLLFWLHARNAIDAAIAEGWHRDPSLAEGIKRQC